MQIDRKAFFGEPAIDTGTYVQQMLGYEFKHEFDSGWQFSQSLRYGHLYGPGTGTDSPPASAPLHVDEAARTALLAVDRGAAGIYNIVERDDLASAAKARRELGWRAIAP